MQPNDDSPAVEDGPLPLADAVDRLRRTLICATGVEIVPLGRAPGRILADDLVSTRAVPAFDAAAMDGWAVRSADLGHTALPVGGRIAAGHPFAVPIRPGHAYRIFTGAPLPSGLDTVVAQEMAREADGLVHLPPMPAGVNVRRAGEAVAVGDRPLRAGTILGPAHLGVAAMLGLAELPVRIRLRVAVASTGDEVCEPGSPLPAGGLYDANRIGLIAMLGAMGCAVTDLGILADQPDRLAASLAQAALDHDLIVTSGGASVGEEDHLQAVIRRLGRLDFWRLAIKPGKPMLVGRIGSTPLLGLPGNPVAVMVGFLLVGREVVAALAGALPPNPRRYPLPAAFSFNKPAGRREFPRARLDESGAVHLFPSDSSGALTSISGSDGLVDLPEDVVEIRPGDSVAFLPFSELMGQGGRPTSP